MTFTVYNKCILLGTYRVQALQNRVEIQKKKEKRNSLQIHKKIISHAFSRGIINNESLAPQYNCIKILQSHRQSQEI